MKEGREKERLEEINKTGKKQEKKENKVRSKEGRKKERKRWDWVGVLPDLTCSVVE